VHIAAELASALTVVHAQGVVHRDIKPANILIGADGQVRLVDFGIAHLLREPTITRGHGLLGTANYTAPEQAVNSTAVDGRADVYSLAAVTYFLLIGSPPFRGPSPDALLRAAAQDRPVPPRQLDPRIPEQVSNACLRGLAQQPAQRFQTAEDFRNALVDGAGHAAEAGFCPSCGTTAGPDAEYCAGCGAGLGLHIETAARCLACGASVGQLAACPACRRRFGRVDHRLLFSGGALAGHVFRVPEGEYVVGRTELLARDQHISRRQLRVVCANGSVQVQHAGGANTTFVAGRPAERLMPLQAGFELIIAGNNATYTRF
jgi:hypothetical protein